MLYLLNCGRHQQHVHAKKIYKKRQSLKYKQWKRKLYEGGDAALNKMSLEHKIPTVFDLTESPLDIFITLSTNDCGYEGTTKEFIVNWFHLLYLKAHYEASKEGKPNWNQSFNGPFYNEYWQAA